MLDMDEINKEIKKLEECNCTTYSVCQKLASLYIVRDHFKNSENYKMNNNHSYMTGEDIAIPAMK